MAIKVPTAADAAKKLGRVAPTRSQDYADGVNDPNTDWEGGASAAKEAWQEGTQDAITRDAFTKGVRTAGNQRWRDKTQQLGVPRWSPGVTAALPDYADAMGPVLETISKVQLPARGKRGDPRNYQRVSAVGDALSMMRTGSRR